MRDVEVRIIDGPDGPGIALNRLTVEERLEAQRRTADLLMRITERRRVDNAASDNALKRFSVEQEMDDEPVCVCDDATDPDSEAREVVTIDPSWGTPYDRGAIARNVVALMSVVVEPVDRGGSNIDRDGRGNYCLIVYEKARVAAVWPAMSAAACEEIRDEHLKGEKETRIVDAATGLRIKRELTDRSE